MELKTPLTFSHVYSSAPWGGGWIRTLFGRTDAPDICSESWEVSGHPFGMSRMKNGPYAGCSLADLTEKFGTALTGTKAPVPGRFPLLIKLLDARRSLSVQVHPSEANASLTGALYRLLRERNLFTHDIAYPSVRYYQTEENLTGEFVPVEVSAAYLSSQTKPEPAYVPDID